MIRAGLLLAALASCNAWTRPAPRQEEIRQPEVQRGMAVKVEATCDPFKDGGKSKAGSGVMVSEWQVLTAQHVIDCPSAIVSIHVTTDRGNRYRFSFEKEWKDNDVARIQMSSGDSFRRNVSPPTLRLTRLTRWEPVYIQAAWPEREEIIGEATGYAYGGSGYGGSRDTRSVYKAATQKGNSGSGVYDINGDLVCIHVGYRADDTKECGTVTEDMLPR